MVIARYISKEILSTFALIMFILLFVALSNEFVTYLTKAASGKLPVSLVFTVVGLSVPELICLLAPVAIFVAILFSYSRLYADSEAAVLFTCGFDWQTLVRMTLWIAGALALVIGLVNIFLVPIIAQQREELLADGQIPGVISAITPGRFQTIDDNEQLVFYVEDVQPNGGLKNIFIAQQPNTGDIVVLTAKTAQVKQQANENEFYLVLHQGYRYVGIPGAANYTVTSFAQYGRELKYHAASAANVERARPIKDILRSAHPGDKAELQWRLSMPLAIIILALLAIPLAKVQPRQGRFAKLLPAIVIYMLYYNLLTVVKRWVANGVIPALPGLWAVHVLFLLIAIALLYRTSGRWFEFKYEHFRSIPR